MILNKDNFKQEVEDNKGLVFIDFFATWCGPCQMMAPIVEEMIKENNDPNVKIAKLNVDEAQEIAMRYNIMSIPTFVVFKDGKMVDRESGYRDKEDLLNMIKKNLSK